MPFIRCNKSKPLAIAEPFNLSVTAFFFLINRYHCVFPSFHDISTSASKSLSANCTEVYKPAPLFSVNIQKNAGPIVRALDAGDKLFWAFCVFCSCMENHGWAVQESNLRLPPCEGGTLPLSYPPQSIVQRLALCRFAVPCVRDRCGVASIAQRGRPTPPASISILSSRLLLVQSH